MFYRHVVLWLANNNFFKYFYFLITIPSLVNNNQQQQQLLVYHAARFANYYFTVKSPLLHFSIELWTKRVCEHLIIIELLIIISHCARLDIYIFIFIIRGFSCCYLYCRLAISFGFWHCVWRDCQFVCVDHHSFVRLAKLTCLMIEQWLTH